MTAPALVLFAHGARDSQWAAPFLRVREAVHARYPDRAVVLAYLEFMQPDLGAAVDGLVAAGHRAIRVVPLFLGPGGHLRHELPQLVEAARARHPGVAIEVTRPAGEDDAVIAALADYAAR